MKHLAALALALAACEPHDVLGTGWDLPGLAVVYQCDVGEQQVELCWDDGASSLERSLVEHELGDAATCKPTPRHLGPCNYNCPPTWGCNAFAGCWCPEPD